MLCSNARRKQIGDHFLEQFDSLTYQLLTKGRQSRYISAWSGKTGGDKKRRPHCRHDNRYCSAGFLGRLNGGGPSRHYYIDFETNELGREVRKSLGVTIRRPVFND